METRATLALSFSTVGTPHQAKRKAHMDTDLIGQIDGERPIRVLIVEDDIFIAMDMVDALSAAGFEVIGPAATPIAALRYVKDESPDLVVTDFDLGGGPSPAYFEALAATGVPFLIVSGSAMIGSFTIAAVRSARQLKKPFVTDVLVRTIGDMTRKGSS